MGDQSDTATPATPVVIGERDHVMVTRDIHFPIANRNGSPGPYINPIGDTSLIVKRDSVGIVQRVSTYTEIPRDKDIPVAYVAFSMGNPHLWVEICIQCSDLLLIYKASTDTEETDDREDN